MSNSTEQCAVKVQAPRVNNGCLRNGGNLSSLGEEVRTLFVSGLPMDVRLRELYLLFRFFEGYEGSFLKLISSKPGKSPQPIAFVSFDTRKHAEKALEELQGIHFDPASAQTLRLEFARTNSRVSPKQHSYAPQQPAINVASPQSPLHTGRNGQLSGGSPHMARGSTACLPATTAVGAGGQNVLTLADCWAPTRMHNMLPSVSYPNPAGTLSPASSTAHLSVMSILSDSESSAYPTPVSTPDLDEQRSSSEVEEELKEERVVSSSALSTTLSVANITREATEDDISSVFSSCSGFVKLRLVHQNGGNCQTALIEFADVDCAKAAMLKFQGSNFEWFVNGSGPCIEVFKQDSRDAAMEYSSSPPSTNGTLSPKQQTPCPQFSPRSPGHQHRYPPAENHCHPSPPIVHVTPRGEIDDSAVLQPRPVNPVIPVQPPVHYTSPNVKHFNGTPSFMYPSTGVLMNQHVIQPMWH